MQTGRGYDLETKLRGSPEVGQGWKLGKGSGGFGGLLLGSGIFVSKHYCVSGDTATSDGK
jgi:hypothetical protein